MIQSVKGFKDILPNEIELWQNIEETSIELFKNFGFKEIRTSIIEHTELFNRSIGQNTDIIEKEMYTFKDRNDDSLTLRPEATASIVRSYIQHKLYNQESTHKFYTIGPMFRRERPQKGRYRQFYQLNAEVFGISSPYIDSQLIFMIYTLLLRLNINNFDIHINSLGCSNCRPKFKYELTQFIANKTEQLCTDCQRRSVINPFRILDCKIPICHEIVINAPSVYNCLCSDCKDHFNTIKTILTNLHIPFKIDNTLVRGLDYYTRTVFEFQTNLLGSQNAIAGGGRYDELIKTLDGPDIPSIGVAIGLDRIVEIIKLNTPINEKHPDLFIAALGNNAQLLAIELLCIGGNFKLWIEMDTLNNTLKSQMKKADKLNVPYVLIIGDKEIGEKKVILQNMKTKEQIYIDINITNIIYYLITLFERD